MLTEECAASLITESPVKNTAPSIGFAREAVSVISLSARRVISHFVLQAQLQEVNGCLWQYR